MSDFLIFLNSEHSWEYPCYKIDKVYIEATLHKYETIKNNYIYITYNKKDNTHFVVKIKSYNLEEKTTDIPSFDSNLYKFLKELDIKNIKKYHPVIEKNYEKQILDETPYFEETLNLLQKRFPKRTKEELIKKFCEEVREKTERKDNGNDSSDDEAENREYLFARHIKWNDLIDKNSYIYSMFISSNEVDKINQIINFCNLKKN
jgi:hypothetical protein